MILRKTEATGTGDGREDLIWEQVWEQLGEGWMILGARLSAVNLGPIGWSALSSLSTCNAGLRRHNSKNKTPLVMCIEVPRNICFPSVGSVGFWRGPLGHPWGIAKGMSQGRKGWAGGPNILPKGGRHRTSGQEKREGRAKQGAWCVVLSS